MQFVNTVKRLVFDLTKLPFLKRLIGISRLIVEVLDDQNPFTESNLANWFSSYVQLCSGDHFSEPAEAARQCESNYHSPVKCSCFYSVKNWSKGRHLKYFIGE